MLNLKGRYRKFLHVLGLNQMFCRHDYWERMLEEKPIKKCGRCGKIIGDTYART